MKVHGDSYYTPRVDYEKYYTSQSGTGSNVPVYSRTSLQHGNGLGDILKGIVRSAIPLAMPFIKKGANRLLTVGTKTGKNVIQDLGRGKDIRSSLKRRGRESVGQLLGVSSSKRSKTTKIPGTRKRSRNNSRRRGPVRKTQRDIFN